MNVSKHDGRPPYFHANWERAIHRFHRDHPSPENVLAGSGAHNVWLANLHRFHAQWYAVRENRKRAEEIVECEVCKADYEIALLHQRPFPPAAPPLLAEAIKRRCGIIPSGRRVSTGDLTPLI